MTTTSTIKNIQELYTTGLVAGMAFRTNPTSATTLIFTEDMEIASETVYLVTYEDAYTTTIKVTDARSAKFLGKTVTVNNETGIATMGRTEYRVEYHGGGFSVQDLKTISLHKVSGKFYGMGIQIFGYEIV